MKRSRFSPILTRADVPDVPPYATDVSAVFNPGVWEHDGRVRMLLRVQTRGRQTVTMLAESDDGVAFRVRPRLLEVEGIDALGVEIFHVYDFRVTRLEGEPYAVFAADTPAACRLGVARVVDGERLELVGFDREGEARNGVIFPERVGGRYLRLERPNDVELPSGVRTGEAIWLAESDDLVSWRRVAAVMDGRPHYWDEWIGSGPPPVKTREGWLHLYHGVATHFAASNLYQAGVVLLDLEDPTRVLARSRDNVLEPRELYEQVGQVPNVVFPSGWIVERYDEDGFAAPQSRVRVYYGAADTCVGLAETTIEELLGAR